MEFEVRFVLNMDVGNCEMQMGFHFEEKQISFRSVIKKFFTGKAILETAKSDNIETVIIGKKGSGNKSDIGSVTGHIIQKPSTGAVWMIP